MSTRLSGPRGRRQVLAAALVSWGGLSVFGCGDEAVEVETPRTDETAIASVPRSADIAPRVVWDEGGRLSEQIDTHGYRALVLETQVADDGAETPLFLYSVEVSDEGGMFRSFRAFKRRSEIEGPPRIDADLFGDQAEAWAARLDEFPEDTVQRRTASGWILERSNGRSFDPAWNATVPEPTYTLTSLAFRPSRRGPTQWIESPQIEAIESTESDGAAFRVQGALVNEAGGELPDVEKRVARLHFDADPPLLRYYSITGDPSGEYEVWELERRIVETQSFPGHDIAVPVLLETFERFGEEAHVWTERRRIRVVFLP
ncbi:MAG: hypothetical protein AAGG07_06005 [Planctomycetota bacterium]